MQVRCVRFKCPNQTHEQWDSGCKIEIGGIYDVVRTLKKYGTDYYELIHDKGTAYLSEMFEPYNPYSNSVSKELAEKAMNVGDGADQPIKIKELETSN